MSPITSAPFEATYPISTRPGEVTSIIILLVAGELFRIGWYGSAALALFAALVTMRWLWWVVAFLVGRRLFR